jgi:hypothetical protein
MAPRTAVPPPRTPDDRSLPAGTKACPWASPGPVRCCPAGRRPSAGAACQAPPASPAHAGRTATTAYGRVGWSRPDTGWRCRIARTAGHRCRQAPPDAQAGRHARSRSRTRPARRLPPRRCRWTGRRPRRTPTPKACRLGFHAAPPRSLPPGPRPSPRPGAAVPAARARRLPAREGRMPGAAPAATCRTAGEDALPGQHGIDSDLTGHDIPP